MENKAERIKETLKILVEVFGMVAIENSFNHIEEFLFQYHAQTGSKDLDVCVSGPFIFLVPHGAAEITEAVFSIDIPSGSIMVDSIGAFGQVVTAKEQIAKAKQIMESTPGLIDRLKEEGGEQVAEAINNLIGTPAKPKQHIPVMGGGMDDLN